VFVINNVALAVEGLTGIRDDFLYLLNIELERRRGVDSLYEMKVIAEDIVASLAERYRERIREESPIGVLMAGRAAHAGKGYALLHTRRRVRGVRGDAV
jgi:hypothetical protein